MKSLKTKKKRVTTETCELTSLTMEDKGRKRFPCRLPQWDPLRFALPTLGRISIIKHLPKGPWNHFKWIKSLQSTSLCQQRQFCNVFDCGAQIKSSRTGVGSCCFWLPVADPALMLALSTHLSTCLRGVDKSATGVPWEGQQLQEWHLSVLAGICWSFLKEVSSKKTKAGEKVINQD